MSRGNISAVDLHALVSEAHVRIAPDIVRTR